MPDDLEYVDGIEVLSKLCDERGLEHWDSEAMACETHIFVDKAGNPHECWEAPDGMVNVVISMTPEQAVELGRGTCHLLSAPQYGDDCKECSACGAVFDEYMFKSGRCPSCGAEVVEE